MTISDPSLGSSSLERPRIGLALGGGSARGWAHIGIIRELTEAGIPIDVLAGTSIGAVVGACHAAGKLDALEAFARALNRRRVFGLMDLSLGGTGLVAGARLKRRLQRDLGGLVIADLSIPFAAIATELGTGREIPIAAGDLVEAMRASYALPGLFEPIRIDDRWLFDGAMSNPVPVSVCRAMGADIVLAVSLTSDLDGPGDETDHSVEIGETYVEPEIAVPPRRRARFRRRLLSVRRRLFSRRSNGAPGIASVVVGAFSIAQERISRSRLAIDPPDILMPARLTTVGLFDFHRAAMLIEHGRSIARKALPEIAARLAQAEMRAMERARDRSARAD